MLDKPYEAKEGSCFYCEKTTTQYYTEDNQWICDDCLFELEEEMEEDGLPPTDESVGIRPTIL